MTFFHLCSIFYMISSLPSFPSLLNYFLNLQVQYLRAFIFSNFSLSLFLFPGYIFFCFSLFINGSFVVVFKKNFFCSLHCLYFFKSFSWLTCCFGLCFLCERFFSITGGLHCPFIFKNNMLQGYGKFNVGDFTEGDQ